MLAWHVDYWDRLGWKDPFGAKAHTERQRALSKARELENIWTPMLCVDGKPVRGNKFRDAVAAARAADAKLRAEVEAQSGIAAKIRLAGDAELPRSTELIAVLFQEKATTKCTAGENKGKTLVEYFVVRAVSGALDLDAAKKDGVTAKFEAPKGVRRKDLGIAFLLEDRAKMKTIDCWWISLPQPAEKPSEKKKRDKPSPRKTTE